MKYLLYTVIILSILSCQKRKEYLIQIPAESHITSEEILTQLEIQISETPDNERIIRQQLHFCEQLGWPARCEKVLIQAKDKWGMSEKLLDQSIAYYLRFEQYDKVASLLNGAFETRSRLETKIQIAKARTPDDQTFLRRYLDQYQDTDAYSLGSTVYLELADTLNATVQFDKLFTADSTHPDLLRYYPILEVNKRYDAAIQIIENQIDKRNNRTLTFDLAQNYKKIDSLEIAMKILRELDTESSRNLLIKWFRERQEWDSALAHVNVLLANDSQNRTHVLTKAEVLEAKGWVTPSLPFYELAFQLDTTDVELAQHLEIVRRKVAYLRRKREQENRLLPPTLERKTGN